ncbi:Galactokinase [Arthrobacter saudimassiliensis]|uniref:Galactokinase n=1 Tax=Arthrobacter saudimassiliensis TaxID=1461584 RepID=A0A078MH68_9MICC|nr:Galactokinase [Arthrobacter saudimassiliensis]
MTASHPAADAGDLRRSRLAGAFTEEYGTAPDGAWRAPGRVNLIGEHTDYNDGFVLPFAIDRSVLAAVRLRADGGPVRLASTYGASGLSRSSFDLAALAPGTVSGWGAYPAGVVHALQAAGHQVPGFDLLLDSTVPVGAGLSSSHAVEVAVAVALNELLGLGLSAPELARLTQRAENDFVGAPTGIMDQSASLMGSRGRALFLDCRTLSAQSVPLPLAEQGLTVLVIDTRVAHSHADGGYGARRASCEAAAAAFGVPSLRRLPADADLSRLDPTTRARVQHVLAENERVLAAVRVLQEGRIRDVGPLLTDSHRSLRDLYEVSCPELDAAVDAALAGGALGARMTGGGFGGSAIALLEEEAVDVVAAAVQAEFAAHGFAAPALFSVLPADGAGRA